MADGKRIGAQLAESRSDNSINEAVRYESSPVFALTNRVTVSGERLW